MPPLIPLFFLLLVPLANPNPNPSFSILNFPNFDFDLDSKAPSPSPFPSPPPPSASCSDLAGFGDLDTLCELRSSLNLTADVLLSGNGSLALLPGVSLSCPLPGCSLTFNLSRSLLLGNRSSIVAGAVKFRIANMHISSGAVVSTVGMGGDPPARTSGAGTGIHGDGGGHGGRGASCFVKDGDSEEDSWGGDVYAWDSLTKPVSYGSRGGTTSLEKEYGGGGGGRVWMEVKEVLEVDGEVRADGGEGGKLGGGGSGGSVYIVANKM